MNKFEREVARSQLMSEREALEQLEKIYKQAADEICRKLEISNGKISVLLSEIENADEKTLSILQSQIYQRNFQQNIKNQLDFLLQDLNDNQYAGISEYIKNSYDNGFIGTLYNFNMSGVPINIPIDPTLVVRAIYIDSKLSKKLYDELGEDVEVLKRKVSATVSRGIASNMHYNDIARNIANNSKTGLNRAMTITRTEGNRVYNAANLECGKAAKEKGVDDVKQWDSTLDGSTRQHHRQLDGQVRELEEDFEVNGRKAPAPLHFGIPGEDINCRCICLVKPRWDVDSAFTKIDNETGQLLEFQGVEDFEDFKRRYWKSVDKSQKSGIIKVNDNFEIHPDKINKFLLKPGAKHSKEFFDVGYSEYDYEKLFDDISSEFDLSKAVDIKLNADGTEDFSIFADLGIKNKKQFRLVWRKDTPNSKPRLITGHRED